MVHDHFEALAGQYGLRDDTPESRALGAHRLAASAEELRIATLFYCVGREPNATVRTQILSALRGSFELFDTQQLRQVVYLLHRYRTEEDTRDLCIEFLAKAGDNDPSLTEEVDDLRRRTRLRAKSIPTLEREFVRGDLLVGGMIVSLFFAFVGAVFVSQNVARRTAPEPAAAQAEVLQRTFQGGWSDLK